MINASTMQEEDDEEECNVIGLLDIFGFKDMKTNSFETVHHYGKGHAPPVPIDIPQLAPSVSDLNFKCNF